MKKIYSLLCFLAILLLLGACSDRLDVEPRQQIPTDVAISTGENVENILTGVYDESSQEESYGGYMQIMADLYGFTDQATWYGTYQEPKEIYNKSIFTDNSFVRDLWLNGYAAINQANLVLENADLVDEDSRDRVKGEAYFLRALNYFDLNRFFSSPDHTLGVPLTLDGIIDIDQNLEIARAPADQVYQQVISDLQKAIELLPESNGARADKYSAEALLARVQLHIGHYEAARDAADDVIEYSGRSLTNTFADAFNNDTNSSEDLFAFQVNSQDGDNVLVVHYASTEFGGRGGDIAVNDAYLNMFGDSDDRGQFFYIGDYGDVLTSKYTNEYANISLIRLAEMYLIRAEANQRLDTEEGATPLEDINTLRARANADLLTEVTLDDILKERQLEMMFEGFLIWDYTRTGRPVGEIPADSPRLSFPIPLREMDANSLLVQNPGYGS
ncbi:RagB/SusD family nutrient uptake outer membrane protein [Christiangramia fulva]|uniref:RagB/SusD family nutrient uptake outer membrane protein n=1 Tax=Christiangramia fulva TaxID=2126553 RepID=A0A2R3Z1Y5_9FLAO|nr:RagB/SusD family nutrient uptake outer membrane protein [Christiangramia fulva]AVR44277.1 RagB/SusD family nutrient uptake outer membrane protein [Christiangramia fulva]